MQENNQEFGGDSLMTNNHPTPSKLGKTTALVFGIVAFLMPFFFVPSAAFPFQLGKGVLIAFATVLATVLFIITVIKDGKLVMPKNLFFLSVLLIPAVFLVSALVNGATILHFVGYGFDVGSVAFIFIMSLVLFLVSRTFKTKEDIFYSYLGFFVSSGIVFLFQFIRLLAPQALSFGVFTSNLSNMIGNWNDLGIFFGAVLILAMVTLEMIELSKLMKRLLWVAFGLSLLFFTLVNFSTIWIVFAVFAVIFFLYVGSFDRFAVGRSTGIPALASEESSNESEMRTQQKRKVSWSAIILLAVSLIFIFAGQSLGAKLSNLSRISNVEVRPSWVSTLAVDEAAIKAQPLFGSGPNTFTRMWVMYKPQGVNDSVFWNTDFAYGIGFIPSLFATTGIVGFLVWLFFLTMLVLAGLKAIFYPINDLFSRYLITSSFLVSLYFWIAMIFYVPSVVNIFFAFFFTGLFAAALEREGIFKTKEFSLKNHPKLSFVSVLALVVLLIGSVSLFYLIGKGSLSAFDFEKSVLAYGKDQDADKAAAEVQKAINLGGYDVYYRGLSQIDLVKLNALLASSTATIATIQAPFQSILGDAIANARKATEVNPSDYQNWLSLAQVYASLVPKPFAIPGAYDNAKAAYGEAEKVNPTNPSIPLLLADLEVSNNNLEAARTYANDALALKRTYADAYFLLAQIDVTEGNAAKAIPSLQATVLLTQNNPGLYFQLGLLEYDQRDYNDAINAFAGAIKLENDYANAKYFLGLSLYYVGRNDDAITVFQNLLQTNPDSKDVQNILANLEAKRDPFANIPPPSNKPQSARTPPVPDTTTPTP